MKISEILNNTSHRPWNLPEGNWAFYQEWNRVIFLHWKIQSTQLRKYVPEQLEIDEFEGEAWISLVAFTMENIRPRYLPAFPPISDFDEINIRTYVKYKDKPGVYFLSIEGGKWLSCEIAKAISELPYRFSNIKRQPGSYQSRNKRYQDTLNLDYKIKEIRLQKSELDLWLTERYALFQETNDSINEFDIHHLEWQIHNIEFNQIELNYQRFADLIVNKPDLFHYSDGVQVIAWNKNNHPVP